MPTYSTLLNVNELLVFRRPFTNMYADGKYGIYPHDENLWIDFSARRERVNPQYIRFVSVTIIPKHKLTVVNHLSLHSFISKSVQIFIIVSEIKYRLNYTYSCFLYVTR